MPTKFPWKELLQAAADELDTTKCSTKLALAEAAIFSRLQELDEEQEEIKKATVELRRIQTERLKWPPADIDQCEK